MLDPLESRTLLSISLLDNGTVVVRGTPRADTITLRPHVENAQEFILVSDNGKTRTIPVGLVQRVHVFAGKGNDLVDAEINFIPTTITGGAGRDSLYGSTGNDLIDGGAGHDLIRAREGNDTLWGGQHNDTLSAGPGNDLLFGAQGNDTMDAVDVDLGSDTVRGGKGIDTAQIDEPPLGNDRVFKDVEHVS